MELIILPAFRANVPEVPDEIAKPGWRLPLYIIRREGIDLYFGPLLLFEKAIIDNTSYEFLETSDKEYLEPIKESVRILKEDGFIKIVDFKPLLERCKESVSLQTINAIENPREWPSAILKSLLEWEAQLPQLRSVIGNDYDPTSLHSEFGTYVYLMKRDGRIIPSEEERIMKLMRSNRQRMSSKDIDELREIVKPTVSYLYTNIAISEMLETPFIDLYFTSDLYGMVYQKSLRNLNPSVAKPIERINIATQLFNLAIPHLRPSSPSRMIKLLQDKRIRLCLKTQFLDTFE